MSLRASLSMNCRARPSKAWIWAACSVWTRRRSRARSRLMRLHSRVRPAVWTCRVLTCPGWTLTFRTLARISTSVTSWQKHRPQISRVSLTVWNSRPSKCSRWERLPTNFLRAFCGLISLGRCHPKILKTRQSSLPHSRHILRMMPQPNNAWLSSRPSAAIPWQSVSSRR